jgi:hypothetical protein
VLTGGAEALFAIGRLDHDVAGALADPADHAADEIFVFDQQDRLPPLRVVRRRTFPVRVVRAGEEQVELRPLAGRGPGGDVPTGLRDDSEHRREPEPRAFARRPRREERLERAREHLGRHPDAGVADRDPNVAAGLERVGPVFTRAGERDDLARDLEAAAVWHGVARVDGEVHHDLLELSDVGAHLAESRRKPQVERHVLAEQAPQRRLERLDDRAYRDRTHDQRLRAAERQQLAGQRGRARRGLVRLRELIVDVQVTRGQVFAGRLEISQDDREHVVEIVGDAPRQATERFELLSPLRLSDQSLRLDRTGAGVGHARGHVSGDTDHHRSTIELGQPCAHLDLQHPAVLATLLGLEDDGSALHDQRSVRFRPLGGGRRVEQSDDRETDHFGLGVAVGHRGGAVREQDAQRYVRVVRGEHERRIRALVRHEASQRIGGGHGELQFTGAISHERQCRDSSHAHRARNRCAHVRTDVRQRTAVEM